MKARGCFTGTFVLMLFALASFTFYRNQYPSGISDWIPGSKSGNIPEVFQPDLSDITKYVSVPIPAESNAENILDMKSIINLPGWLRHEKQGLKKVALLEKLTVTTRGDDKEEITAWDNFFYGMTEGLMLEMGAMNGKDFSVSHFFETSADWRVILIEGNPSLATHLAENRPKALNFNVAICDKPGQVHFISMGGLSGVDGVLEFMSQGYLKACYPELLMSPGNETLDWEKVKTDNRVSLIQCLPLANILAPLKINHLNFFLLDVEGGELNILKAIDFAKITFDVIAVETDRGLDDAAATQAYVDAVSELLTSKGYVLWTRKLGRNSWFLHPSFTPSAKPKQ
jgi:FkbM family methyltransferase